LEVIPKGYIKIGCDFWNLRLDYKSSRANFGDMIGTFEDFFEAFLGI